MNPRTVLFGILLFDVVCSYPVKRLRDRLQHKKLNYRIIAENKWDNQRFLDAFDKEFVPPKVKNNSIYNEELYVAQLWRGLLMDLDLGPKKVQGDRLFILGNGLQEDASSGGEGNASANTDTTQ